VIERKTFPYLMSQVVVARVFDLLLMHMRKRMWNVIIWSYRYQQLTWDMFSSVVAWHQ